MTFTNIYHYKHWKVKDITDSKELIKLWRDIDQWIVPIINRRAENQSGLSQNEMWGIAWKAQKLNKNHTPPTTKMLKIQI